MVENGLGAYTEPVNDQSFKGRIGVYHSHATDGSANKNIEFLLPVFYLNRGRPFADDNSLSHRCSRIPALPIARGREGYAQIGYRRRRRRRPGKGGGEEGGGGGGRGGRI